MNIKTICAITAIATVLGGLWGLVVVSVATLVHANGAQHIQFQQGPCVIKGVLPTPSGNINYHIHCSK